MAITKMKLITSIEDILEANIIDFNRLNGYWGSPVGALNTILSWFKDAATIAYMHFEDFHDAPERDDWPEWKHVGNHPELGRKYWNWFFWNFPKGELRFSDSPDFQGFFPPDDAGHSAWFWGDIGQVSASAFTRVQKLMNDGAIWISILGDGRDHVVIQPHYNISDLWGKIITGEIEDEVESMQLKLFQ
ncbi:MAG: hypothetical protein M3261_01485 [Thermoproteota archaeon]|nr:hypothetical protein [Thermoproteota archaeon]